MQIFYYVDYRPMNQEWGVTTEAVVLHRAVEVRETKQCVFYKDMYEKGQEQDETSFERTWKSTFFKTWSPTIEEAKAKCFAPLKYQSVHVAGRAPATIIDGAVEVPYKFLIFKFTCLSCSSSYKELHQRNAHEMAIYVAAQEKNKDIAARKAQSKKKKKGR